MGRHRSDEAPLSRTAPEAAVQHARRAPLTGGWRSWLRWAALGVSTVLVIAVGMVVLAVHDVAKNVTYIAGYSSTAKPDLRAYKGAVNLLLIGSDSRAGQDKSSYGDASKQSASADVMILIHLNSAHTNAVAMSFPRDLMVSVPSCPKNDGSGESYSAMSSVQLNSTLSYGGASCTAKTIESLTGLDIPFVAEIGFDGVVEMTNAVGGVSVCVTSDINDRQSGLQLSAGEHVIQGAQALSFLRDRHGIGDGSDLGRISGQQVYMASLVRKLHSEKTLSDPVKVYKLASAATRNMQFSSNLGDVSTLAQLATAASHISLENVVFLQAPTAADPTNSNRVVFDQPLANQLFAKLKADEVFQLSPAAQTGAGSVVEGSASASASAESETSASASAEASASSSYLPDSVRGQTAATQTCAKAQK
ncbi:MAG: LCP family protein [Microbacteriaceae bacterium]|nr:LCP family protein [Microbacteriaceae bacterium]